MATKLNYRPAFDVLSSHPWFAAPYHATEADLVAASHEDRCGFTPRGVSNRSAIVNAAPGTVLISIGSVKARTT